MSSGGTSAHGMSMFGADGAWVESAFTLADHALGILQAGSGSEWRWEYLRTITSVDQVGTDPEGRPVLEFLLADQRTFGVRVADDVVAAIVERLQLTRRPAAAVPDPPSSSSPPPPPPPPPPPGPRRSGSKAALAQEVQELRAYIDALGAGERAALAEEVAALERHLGSLREHRDELVESVRSLTADERAARAQLVQVRREAILQDAGVYRFRHPAESSTTLASKLASVRRRIEDAVVAGEVVSADREWAPNESRSAGAKLVDDLAALVTRLYNAEADLLVQTLEPFGLAAAVDRLGVTRDAIARLGRSMDLVIVDDFHRARVEELELTAEHLARVAEESATRDTHGTRLYVVSNPGAFGPGIVRIGLTDTADQAALRLELDGRALPFPSDVHALAALPDVVGVLDGLRHRLDAQRVNLTDPSCEFFHATPADVRDLLLADGVLPASFVDDAPAVAWRQSENTRSLG
ncbi:MAG: hypothetical protein U0Q22_11770 [Acidimicrobiales bacterium]